MAPNQDYLRKVHGCYPDAVGNYPCDNGALCDACMVDATVKKPYTAHMSDEELCMVSQVKMMQYALDYCCIDHDAKVTIVVEHTNGTKVVADLYTHAALIQGLQDALEYFLSEL